MFSFVNTDDHIHDCLLCYTLSQECSPKEGNEISFMRVFRNPLWQKMDPVYGVYLLFPGSESHIAEVLKNHHLVPSLPCSQIIETFSPIISLVTQKGGSF